MRWFFRDSEQALPGARVDLAQSPCFHGETAASDLTVCPAPGQGSGCWGQEEECPDHLPLSDSVFSTAILPTPSLVS